jgi:hypothetical protein
VVLVHILLRVDEDQVGLEVPAEFEEVFEDLLTGIREDTRGKGTQDDLLPGNLQHRHCLVVFVHYIFQIRIFLVVGEGDAQYIGLFDDVVQQRAASQFDIVRVRAEEKDSFAEEVHYVVMSLRAQAAKQSSQ